MKDLTAVYTYEYNLMKKQIKAQAITIALLILLAIISCFYNIRQGVDYETLKQEKQVLEDLTEMQSSMIADLEENCNKLFEELEYVKAEVGFNISDYIEK